MLARTAWKSGSGRLTSFEAIMSGTPARMWMEGTITYHPAAKQ